MKSVYVIAKVLKNLHNKLCLGKQGLCANMRNALYRNKGSLVEEMNLLTVDFRTEFPFVAKALSNISFTFMGGNGAIFQEGFPDYEIYQYRTCVHNSGSFCFEKVTTSILFSNMSF